MVSKQRPVVSRSASVAAALSVAVCACGPRPPPGPDRPTTRHTAPPIVVLEEPSGPPDGADSPQAARPPFELPDGGAERVAAALASLLGDEGPVVRLRLFLPDPAVSASPEFDAEASAVVGAMAGASPRLARVDVTVGPHADDAVTSMRGAGILPRTGGDPGAVRALLVAVGDAVTPVPDLRPSPGSGTVQLVLALHRVLRGPVRVGVVAPARDRSAVADLASVLDDFERVLVDDPTVAADDLAALVVLASGGGPLPAGTEALARGMLARGRGVVLIGGPMEVREAEDRMEVVRSGSDPAAVLRAVSLSFGAGMVLDPSCARVSVPSRLGRMFLSYPPMVRTRVTFPDGAGEATAVLSFASFVATDRAAGDVEVLAWSSPESWVEDGGAELDPSRDWRPSGEIAARPLVVAVRVPADGAAADGRAGRFAVIPTARIARADNATLEGNETVLAALVAWTAGVEELFGLRADHREVATP